MKKNIERTLKKKVDKRIRKNGKVTSKFQFHSELQQQRLCEK